MENCIHWFYICLALIGLILFLVAMFMNYNLKLKDKSLELEKKHEQNKQRCYKLEQKNGAEQRQINELKAEIEKLKERK